MRLLVVEDERKVANALREGLEGEGYEVVIEETGEDALTRSTTERFDLVLLDLGLPGRDGLEIVTDLRDEGVNTPVLILTARDTVDDRVKGLNGGDIQPRFGQLLGVVLDEYAGGLFASQVDLFLRQSAP